MAMIRKNDTRPWFVYIRVSSKDQGEKYGPAVQLAAIRAWLKANVPDAHVPGLDACLNGTQVRASEYIGFDKQTGKNDDRADFQRGQKLAKEGKIAGFVSYRLDRVARNVANALMQRSKMKRMGVRYEFATQRFDDGPMGDLMYTLYAGYAQLEGELILERTAGGRETRVKEDKLFISPNGIPFGYLYVDEDVAKANPGAVIGRAIIHPAQGPIVQLVFRLYIEEGLTCYEIMMRLNDDGVLTAKECQWWDQSIRNILAKADRYAGTYKVRLGITKALRDHAARVEEMGENAGPIDLENVQEVELDLPQLITPEQARLALALLNKNKKDRAGRPTLRWPLSHRVTCSFILEDGSRCGAPWYFRNNSGSDKTGIGYCSKHNYEGRGIRMKCGASQIRYTRMEDTVIGAMKAHLREPKVAHAAAMQAHRAEQKANRGRGDLEAKLATLKTHQKHFGAILMNPGLTKLHGEANSQFQELEIQIQDLERELRRAPVAMIYSQEAIVRAYQERLALLDEIQTVEDKNEFLDATVQGIECNGKEMVITGTIAVAEEQSQSSPTPQKRNRSLDCDLFFTVNKVVSFPFRISTPVIAQTAEERSQKNKKVWEARRRNGTDGRHLTPEQRAEMGAKAWEARRRNGTDKGIFDAEQRAEIGRKTVATRRANGTYGNHHLSPERRSEICRNAQKARFPKSDDAA